MKDARIRMGMPVTVEIIDGPSEASFDAVYHYFTEIDQHFSTYRADSDISRMNRGEPPSEAYQSTVQEVLALAERTRAETDGYFDMRRPDGTIDPSGIVKGWAIKHAAALLFARGHRRFCIEVGGDIASSGRNEEGEAWSVGIRNPFDREEVVKVVYPRGRGVATSGTATRGQHIYNPHKPGAPITDTASITVIGPDVLEADRFATAAFAMGKEGAAFIERLPGFEAYQIGADGIATMTSGFDTFTNPV